MKTRSMLAVALLLSTAIITFGQSAPNKTTPLKVGAIAPDFTLADTKGEKVTLSKLNQPTVLVFYRGYW